MDTLRIPDRLTRYNQFYSAENPGHLLVITSFPGKSETITFDLRDYDFSQEREHERYWDGLIEQAFCSIQDHQGVVALLQDG